MTRYRVTFEFDLAEEHGESDLTAITYNFTPATWAWHELIDIDDLYTQINWNSLRIDRV